MKTKIVLSLLFAFIITFTVKAQICAGNSFPGISQPSNCTYTYTSSGWFDNLGNPTGAPSNNRADEAICILYDYTGDLNFTFKGTFYIGPNAVYTGSVSSFSNTAQLLIEGEAKFTNAPTFSGNEVIVGENGTMGLQGALIPQGSAIIHNAGQINANGDFHMGGQAQFINYPNSKLIVQGDSSSNAPFDNCGLFELYGSLTTGGSSGLNNLCSTYVHSDVILNADYTNDALLLIAGSLNFGSATMYNNDTMVMKNITLNNDNLVGNDDTSILIVGTNAILSSGGSITGHLFYDMDDGGGFDSVCGSCTEDIDIVDSATVPSDYSIASENCGSNIVIDKIIEKSQLDFDGIDDYLSTNGFINGLSQATVMAWVKIDNTNNLNSTILGEGDAFRFFTVDGNNVKLSMRTNTGVLLGFNGVDIKFQEWHHVAATFNNVTGTYSFYIDGQLKNEQTNSSLIGNTIEASGIWNGKFEVGRRSMNYTNKHYFAGHVDEVRVFSSALTAEQVQQMVYQEIENNGGLIKGKEIPKLIEDTMILQNVAWTDLLVYYPMTDIISYGRTTDFSVNKRITKLHNITSMQQQTAPMPYETVSDGDWSSESTWLYGDVWDIEDASQNKDWSIVSIKNDITTSSSHTSLGLIVDADKQFVVNGDNKIENTYYLELNGTLDLMDDSQLVQGLRSDLVTSATGRVKRRQEGNSSQYRYNYWGSPLGSLGATPLTDNNTVGNNDNNSEFNLGMLKQPGGTNFEFTGALDAPGKISVFWLYTYINGVTYNDWGSMDANTPLEPGIGYTQKGTGAAGTEQQYLFEGKPNNGTIIIDVSDTGGSGSVPAVSKTDFLLGNPYPSALDLHQFIDDNVGIIDGTIQLWQQWSGDSHILNEYNGGYAQVNKTGSVRAYQFVGIEGANNGSQDGTKKPSRYLPVGQGFMVEVIADGEVMFNNGQRLFVKEADHDGTYNNGSIFFKNGTAQGKSQEDEDLMHTLRLEFSSVDGPDTRRELLLGFSDFTTEDFDYGYEAKNTEVGDDDLNLVFGDDQMTIQAYSSITDDKAVPLKLTASGDHNYTIALTETQNIDEGQEIYLRDNLTGEDYDLRNNVQPYEFSSETGEHADRFEVVFAQQSETLSQIDQDIDDLRLYYAMGRRKIVVMNPNSVDIARISVTNILGQRVYDNSNAYPGSYGEYDLQGLATGTYIVQLVTDGNAKVTKKFIVK